MQCRNGVIAVLLSLCVTACAAPSGALSPVPCQHPQVDPSTHAGLAQGLLAYHAAIELCNSLNGVQADVD